MISTTRDQDKKGLKLDDGAESIVNSNPAIGGVLDAVRAAMKAGLTEFTTPTVDNNDQQYNWQVRKFVHMRGDKLMCHLVAQVDMNPMLQVLGPEFELPPQEAKK